MCWMLYAAVACFLSHYFLFTADNVHAETVVWRETCGSFQLVACHVKSERWK